MKNSNELLKIVHGHLVKGAKVLELGTYYNRVAIEELDIDDDGYAEIIALYQQEGKNAILILKRSRRSWVCLCDEPLNFDEVVYFKVDYVNNTKFQQIMVGGKRGIQHNPYELDILQYEDYHLKSIVDESICFDKIDVQTIKDKVQIIVWRHLKLEAYEIDMYRFENQQIQVGGWDERSYFKSVVGYYKYLNTNYPDEEIYQTCLEDATRRMEGKERGFTQLGDKHRGYPLSNKKQAATTEEADVSYPTESSAMGQESGGDETGGDATRRKSAHTGTNYEQGRVQRTTSNNESQHLPKQQASEAHLPKQQTSEAHLPKQQGSEAHLPKQQGSEAHLPKQQGSETHLPKQQGSETHLPKQQESDTYVSKVWQENELLQVFTVYGEEGLTTDLYIRGSYNADTQQLSHLVLIWDRGDKKQLVYKGEGDNITYKLFIGPFFDCEVDDLVLYVKEGENESYRVYSRDHHLFMTKFDYKDYENGMGVPRLHYLWDEETLCYKIVAVYNGQYVVLWQFGNDGGRVETSLYIS